MKNCEIISYYNYFQMPDECCHGFRTSQGARGFDCVHHKVTLNTFFYGFCWSYTPVQVNKSSYLLLKCSILRYWL